MGATRRLVILMLVFGVLASLPMFLFVPVPGDAKDYVLPLVGFLTAKAADAIAYLLNSTETSATRNAAMAKATEAFVEHATSRPAFVPPKPPVDEFSIPDLESKA
jgi:hypothetical protein